jgi:peptide/nickel transport system substrate-binding protein
MKLRGILASAIVTSFALLSMQDAQAENTLTWPTQHYYRDLDPAAAYDAETYILGNIYETLFYYKDGEVLPRLATAWQKSEGGRVWTVTLRDGVRFHDGSSLDAAAVKKSFEYTRDLGEGAGFLYEGLETVETPDGLTAIFKFKKPIAFDLVASGQYGSYVIAPAAIDKGHDWMNQGNAIGTGPYKLTRFEPDKLTVLDKFEGYWGGWKPGQIDRVIQPVVTEVSTRIQMLKSGEADLAQVPFGQLEALDALDNVAVTTSQSWRNSLYMLNTQKYPTDNKTFREALAHLWDHDTVLKDIYRGYATRPVAPLPVSMWGHGDYSTPSYDPELALKLLKESGVPQSDWKVTAMYSQSNQEMIDAMELFQANAAELGLEVELLPQQSSKTYMTKARSLETAAHMNSMTWYPAYPTPSDWLYSMFRTQEKVSFNLSYYANATFDAAVDAATDAEGVNVEESAKTYIKAQDYLMADTPAIFVADLERAFAYSSKLKGVDSFSNPAYETAFFYMLTKQ